jgi:hypothetical protein
VNLLTVLGVIAAALLLVGFALNQAARWAGKRGWVYNKHNPRPRGSGTSMLVDQIYQPSMHHVIDEQTSERTRAEQDESGEKPDTSLED